MADDQPIRAEHLPDDFFLDLPTSAPPPTRPEHDDLASQYQACGGNISYLARHLGLSRNTLYKRLREQGVRP